jgi:hypothetical protein
LALKTEISMQLLIAYTKATCALCFAFIIELDTYWFIVVTKVRVCLLINHVAVILVWRDGTVVSMLQSCPGVLGFILGLADHIAVA